MEEILRYFTFQNVIIAFAMMYGMLVLIDKKSVIRTSTNKK